MAKARRRSRRWRGVRVRFPAARWKRVLLGIAGALAIFTCGVLGYYYVQFSNIIQARLHGERDRVIPRVYARPLVLHSGRA